MYFVLRTIPLLMSDNDTRLVVLKEQMKKAIQNDKQLNKCGRPALNRLDILDCSIKLLFSLRKEIDTELLFILKEWLEPLPDKTLPNFEIKSNILSLLLYAKVDKSQLIESGIGKIVYFYSLNSKEPYEIRNLSKQLVKKWTMVVVKEQEE